MKIRCRIYKNKNQYLLILKKDVSRQLNLTESTYMNIEVKNEKLTGELEQQTKLKIDVE